MRHFLGRASPCMPPLEGRSPWTWLDAALPLGRSDRTLGGRGLPRVDDGCLQLGRRPAARFTIWRHVVERHMRSVRLLMLRRSQSAILSGHISPPDLCQPAASDAAPPLGRCVFCTASVALAMDSVILAAGACRHIATTANPPGNNVCKCTTRLRPQALYTTARATPPHNNGRSTITPANPPHDDSHTPATQLRPHIPPTPTTAKPPHDNEHKPTTQHRPHICQHNSNRKATTNSGNSTDKRS